MKRFLLSGALFCMLLFVITFISLKASFHFVTDDDYLLAQFDKMQMIDNPNRPASIVLLGGSNVAFGFDSEMLEDSLHIPVINAATHAGLGIKFIVDDCLPRLRKGDILVYSPESTSFYSESGFYGQYALSELFFLRGMTLPKYCASSMKTIAENIPYVTYNNYYSGVTEFKKKMIHKVEKPDPYHRSYFSKQGDMKWHWVNDSLLHYSQVPTNSLTHELLDYDKCDYVVEALKSAQQRGITVVCFSPVAAHDFANGSEYKFSEFAAYMATHGFVYPDSTGVDLMPTENTYNTHYHMNKRGAQLHTKHLISYLKEQT